MALSGEGAEEEWKEVQRRVNGELMGLRWESLSIWAYALAKSGKGSEESWKLIEKRLLKENVDKLDYLASFCYSFSRSPLYRGGQSNSINSNEHHLSLGSSPPISTPPPSSNSSSPFSLSSSSLPPLWRRFERATISFSHQMSPRAAVYLSTSFAKISDTPSPIIFTMVENYLMNILQKENEEEGGEGGRTREEEERRKEGVEKERERGWEEEERTSMKEGGKEVGKSWGEEEGGGKRREGRRRERLEVRDLALILWAFDKMNVGSEALWRLAAGKVKKESKKLNYEDCINLIYGFKGKEMEGELSHILVERLKTILLTWMSEEKGFIRRKEDIGSKKKEGGGQREEGGGQRKEGREEEGSKIREKNELFERMRVKSLELIFIVNPRALEYWRDFGQKVALSYLKSFEKAFRSSQAKLDESYMKNYVDFLYISTFHSLSEDLRSCFGGMLHPVWERRHLFYPRNPDYLNKLVFLANRNKLTALPSQEIVVEMEKFLVVEGVIENLAFFLVNCERYRGLSGERWRRELVEKKVKEAVRGRKVFVDWVMGEEERELVEVVKELRKGEEVGVIVEFVMGRQKIKD